MVPKCWSNPEVVEGSGSWEFDEGCLSVPGHYWTIVRPAWARAAGQDLDGAPVEYAGEELLGRVLQHETDHLNGMLLIERLDGSTVRQPFAISATRHSGWPSDLSAK